MAFGAPFPGGKTPVTKSYNGYTNGVLNASSYSGVSFGVADPSRLVVIVTREIVASPFVTALTIGGISATNVLRVTAGSNSCLTFWVAAVPTGTSGTVAFTVGTSSNVSLESYSLYGAASATPNATNTATNSTTMSLNLSGVSNGSVGLGGALTNGSGAHSWSGLTLDDQSGTLFSSASGSFSAGGSVSISVTVPSSANAQSLAATWGP